MQKSVLKYDGNQYILKIGYAMTNRRRDAATRELLNQFSIYLKNLGNS